jgi:hypothetical protein
VDVVVESEVEEGKPALRNPDPPICASKAGEKRRGTSHGAIIGLKFLSRRYRALLLAGFFGCRLS